MALAIGVLPITLWTEWAAWGATSISAADVEEERFLARIFTVVFALAAAVTALGFVLAERLLELREGPPGDG